MAFEARAELRETRGFISTTTTSPFAGFTANCTFEPPVSTPTARMIANAPSRSRWYSLSESVMIGATVIESPVCTPIASMFSMPQTTTQLSLRSRTTSSSYSFHPSSDLSTWTWSIIDALIPERTISSYSSRFHATPPPVPPRVNAGRMIAGSPIWSRNSIASSTLETVRLSGFCRPTESTTFLNASRSSARRITSRSAPIISTPCSCRMPRSQSSHAQFKPVCPPSVGRIASIGVPSSASRSITLSTASAVIGSM